MAGLKQGFKFAKNDNVVKSCWVIFLFEETGSNSNKTVNHAGHLSDGSIWPLKNNDCLPKFLRRFAARRRA